MKFQETIGEFWKRTRHGKGRRPLRNFVEMSEELGVPQARLRGMMSHYCGPKPVLQHRSNGAGQVKWYDRQEFIEWWETVKDYK